MPSNACCSAAPRRNASSPGMASITHPAMCITVTWRRWAGIGQAVRTCWKRHLTGLAALDILHIPSTIVEPAIAASIVYVAAENFLSRDIDKRWRDTFGFGLIHGFGFASALQEFGLPRSALVPALASFNLGVEIGQIAIVSLVVPALLVMDRLLTPSRRAATEPTRPAFAVYAISAVIIGLGSYWLLARTLVTA